MKPLILFVFTLCSYVLAFTQPDTTQKIIAGRANSFIQQQKPYVVLISIDGFRYDYAEKFDAVNIKALSLNAVKAASMIPSYPSLTFPNHYTIATGLYPSHHGLVGNFYYNRMKKESYGMKTERIVKDGSWYGGTPIWVLAEEQQMLSASFYWVGSEANIKGIYPTYYYSYNEDIPNKRRIEIIKDWLQLPAEKRPHLITVYFPEVDHAGHKYGPDAKQTADAVKQVDSVIGRLNEVVKSTGLPVNFILVSDHGMTKIDTENTIKLPDVVDTSKFIIPRGAELLMLYAKNKKDVKKTYKQLKATQKDFTVYRPNKMSAILRFSTKDDWQHHIGDLLLIPNWPKIFYAGNKKPSPGAHGYNPYLVKDMHAIFYAWGPAFKNNLTVPSFENVNVYPVITSILGLNINEPIDGTFKIAKEILY